MKLARRLLPLAMAASLLWPLLTLACRCREQSVADARAQAKVIFSGTLTGAQEVRVGDGEGIARVAYTFRVTRVYQGQVGQAVTIHTATNSAECGYRFEAGTTYLVYAQDDGDGRLATHTCTRTREFVADGEDLRALGAGQAPE